MVSNQKPPKLSEETEAERNSRLFDEALKELDSRLGDTPKFKNFGRRFTRRSRSGKFG